MYTQSKEFKTRITHKHDVQSNWLQAENKFIPLAGELIIYDADGTYTQPRYKIGNGTDLLGNLPFIDAASVIEELDYTDAPETGKYVSAVTQSNGVIAVTKTALPNKLSDFENDLFYNKKVPFLTLTKSDFQEWVNPNGDIMHIYTGSPKIDWVTSKKDIAFTFSATINDESMNDSNESVPFIDFLEKITDDGESVWDYVAGPFVICNGYDFKNQMNAFLSKDEYTINLMGPPEIFESMTDLNIEIFRVDKKIIDSDVLPEFVGKNVTGTEYIINDESVIAGNGAEIFNNYNLNRASGQYSHAEGHVTTASGWASHAEGEQTTASYDDAHAEGSNTIASGISSHAEGHSTTASGDYSHAEGVWSTASGWASHAEGDDTTASGDNSHAEGENTTASGGSSHAEGSATTASGYESHAEGAGAKASGSGSHAEGFITSAAGQYSHAEGAGTTANCKSQHTQGEYNIFETGNAFVRGTYAHIVGNGSSVSNRSNAHTLDWDGNAWFAGDVYVGSTSGKEKDKGSKKLATEEYVGNQITANAPNLTNYKTKQTAVSSPTASGNATAFIDSISQSANGEITVTKKNVQFPDYSNTYKKIQTAVSSPTASGNTTAFIDTISQDAQGKITVTKKNVQFPDYSNTYQPKGNYKTVQTAVSDPTASGSATAFIDSISQDTNGKITVSKKNITAAALGLDRAMSFLGTTTTALTDGATTNPITINSASITAAKGDVVIVSGTDQEFIWTGSAWEEFGNASSHSIKGHTHTVTHNPAGTISKTSITPAGTVSQPTFSGSAVNSGENTGTNFSAAPGGHKHSVTAAGTVSQPTFTGTEATITISHTPAGTVSQPTFTGSAVTSGKPDTTNVTTIYSITGVGSLPSASLSAGKSPNHTYIAPSLTASIANKCMTFSWSAGQHSFRAGTYPTLTFSAGSLPTRSSAISMPNTNHTHSVTAAGTVSQPTFTGSSVSGSTKYTPAGTVSQPTFTGSAVNSGANTGTNTSVAPAKHKHSVTAAGTVSQPTFTGTAAEHSHTFTGTSATITTSGSSN